jgi:peptidyl-prolyl cis-trans isomerase SurA
LILAPLVLSFGLAALDVQPAYVDRVAAVVGNHIVLLSEVRERAALVARSQHMAVTQLNDSVMHDVAERLVEEQLEQAEADRLKVVVAPDEVERAIEQVAQANHKSPSAFLHEAEKQGVKPDELREALRRQILESKLLMMHSAQMQPIEEKDVRARYEQLKRQVKNPQDLKSFDDLKQEILNELLQERLQQLREDWMAQLRGRTYVEIRVGSES